MNTQINCSTARRHLPGYLDGALAAGEHNVVRQHLDSCAECRVELQRYEKLSALMSRAEKAAAPEDLAVRIRVQIARARQAEPWTARAWSRLTITFQNFLAPLAVPATGGLLSALVVFGVVFYSLLLGVPLGAVPNDVPINRIQPARLEALAPFSVPGETADGNLQIGEHAVLAEVLVDANGRAVDYQIIAGPNSLTVRRQLDQVVFFSRYRPQISFGRPESGGRVVLSFNEVRVKG